MEEIFYSHKALEFFLPCVILNVSVLSIEYISRDPEFVIGGERTPYVCNLKKKACDIEENFVHKGRTLDPFFVVRTNVEDMTCLTMLYI